MKNDMTLNKCAKCGGSIGGSVAACEECENLISRRHSAGSAKWVVMLMVVVVGVILAVFIRTREPSVEADEPSAAVPAVDMEKTRAQAEGGDPKAEVLLGEIYAKGTGVPMDYKEAAKWYQLAADKGDTDAENHLAQLFEVGQGVPRDEAEAAKLFQRAAEKGHVGAQYSLAAMHASGRGLNPNDAEAVKWYRMAAEQGDDLAQFAMGQRATIGKGLPKDPVEAYKWLSLAAAQDLPDAARALEGLKPGMTSEQLAEGQRRVAGFAVKKQTKPAQ